MGVAIYAFANTRAKALKGGLLDAAMLRSLLEAESFEEALTLLKGTAYARDLMTSSASSLEEVERVLARSLLKDYKKLLSSVYGSGKLLLEKLAKRHESNLIKTLIEMCEFGAAKCEAGGGLLIPFGSIDDLTIARLSKAEDVFDLVELLRGSEYYAVLNSALSKYEETRNLFSLFSALDTHVYSRISDKITAVTGTDKSAVRRIVGTEIDAKNALLVLRCKGLGEEKIFELLVYYRYLLSDSFLRTLASTPEALASEASPYQHLASAALEDLKKGNLLPLERAFKKFVLQMSRAAFVGYPFQVGVILGYLNLKENEIRNVSAILKGKEDGLAAHQIEELLIN